jgi:acyl-CoA reductase-like NAD-dependent aldehyde dehydrogenase
VARHAPAERAKCIRDAATILRGHREELAWIDAVDTGNPLQAMRYDVDISAAMGSLCRARHRNQGVDDSDRARRAQLHGP